MDKFSKMYKNIDKPLNRLFDNCKFNDKFDISNGVIYHKDYGFLAFKEQPYILYNEIIKILRENFPNSADTRHKQDIDILLFRIFKNEKKNTEQISKDWLEEIYTRKLKDYTYAGWIAGYPFPTSCRINNVVIIPSNSEEIKNHEFVKKFDDDVFKIEPKPGMNAMFICNVKAYDEESGELISNIYVNRMLSFIKLVDSVSEVRLQKKNYNGISYETFIESDKGIMLGDKNIDRKDDLKRPYDFVKIKNLRDKAEKFFFKKNITEFQKSILSALYWYGRVDTTFDDDIGQYIFYINGLERLVLFDSRNSKADMFAARISRRFPNIKNDEILSIYKKRNCLLHENEPDIYKYEIYMLRNLLRNLILDMICKSDNHEILYSYFKKYDKNDS